MPGHRVWRSLTRARPAPAASEPRWLHRLKLVRAGMVETAAVLIGLLLAALLVWEAVRERVVIEPLAAPRDLAEAGYTGDVVAQRLIAEIRAIQTGAQTTLERSAIGYASRDLEVPISVAGSQISPRALAGYLRNAICGWGAWACRPQLRFGGDIVRSGEGYRIELRLVGGERLTVPHARTPLTYAGDAIDALIGEAAEAVVWRTDPYILASHAYNRDKPKAERLCQTILSEKPPGSAASLRAINLIGLIRQDAGDRDGAEAQYRRAIEIDPDFSVAHMNLGNILHERGQHDAAAASHRRAIALDPGYARAHANLGLALYSKGDRALAVASYRRALELDPRLAIVHSNLCVALMDDDLPRAIAACRRAVEIDSSYAAGHFNLGLVLARKGDLDGAVAAYRRAVELSAEGSPLRDSVAAALGGLMTPIPRN